jgi:hypothetical protein
MMVLPFQCCEKQICHVDQHVRTMRCANSMSHIGIICHSRHDIEESKKAGRKKSDVEKLRQNSDKL